MKEELKQKVARSIEKFAVQTAKETVGKSLPMGIHEVVVPQILKGDQIDEIDIL